jgi:hypothetical protein
MQWKLIRARGIWPHQQRLTAHQWAFANYHLLQDHLDEQATAKANMQNEMALHYILKYFKSDFAKSAILEQPIEGEEDSAAEEYIQRSGDPYFGMIDLPELPDMPGVGQEAPSTFGNLEKGFPQPPTGMPKPGAGFNFPVFPISP